MNFLTDNLTTIVTGLFSLIAGFLGGMTYQKRIQKNNRTNVAQTAGDKSKQYQASGDITIK